MITKDNPLILASSSPRRKDLLEQIGLPFRVFPSNIEENIVIGNPPDISIELAKRKTVSIREHNRDSWILGADTIVVLGKKVLGKPANEEEARYMLRLLCGREHAVITGFAVINPKVAKIHCEYVNTNVLIRDLTEREIDAYIASGEPFGKAGGYAIQGIGSFMVEKIIGSYSNVVGLPLCALIKSFLKLGALEEFPLAM